MKPLSEEQKNKFVSEPIEPNDRLVELTAEELAKFETACGVEGEKDIDGRVGDILGEDTTIEAFIEEADEDSQLKGQIYEMFISNYPDIPNIEGLLIEYTGMRIEECRHGLYLESEF